MDNIIREIFNFPYLLSERAMMPHAMTGHRVTRITPSDRHGWGTYFFPIHPVHRGAAITAFFEAF